MASIIDELKAQARILQRRANAGNPAARARVKSDAEVKRTDCLGVLARELGFQGWPQALAVLEGRPGRDLGTLFYGTGCTGFTNIWSASYEEARAIRAEHGGYLLPYKHQFLIVEAQFLEQLGLDPIDADWELVGRDVVPPSEARDRLYARRVRARQRELGVAA